MSMNTYVINVEWAGYSRGTATYIVDARDEDQAKEIYLDDGDRTEHCVVRDDTEGKVVGIKLIP